MLKQRENMEKILRYPWIAQINMSVVTSDINEISNYKLIRIK